jgi:FkbM family methyltransferase
MHLISYAQNAEDVVLHRAFRGRPTGFYIDVGANDPTVSSVTRCFYDLGWSGINIEPSRGPFGRLAAERVRDINLNVGLSDREGTLNFFECAAESTVSTFSAADARWLSEHLGLTFEEHQMPVLTLAKVCEQHVRGEIDFLSVDAENHEREVLEGNDWTRWRPRVVVIEDGHSSQGSGRNHRKWQDFILQAGYLLALVDGVNRFYLRKEDEDLLPALSVPANAADNFVPYRMVSLHGELVAERERLAEQGARLAEQGARLAEQGAQLAEQGARLNALQHELDETRNRLAPYLELGPTAVGVARRLRNLSVRHPRLSAAVKRLLRLARPRTAGA